MILLDQYEKDLDDVLTIKIPEGYIEVDVREDTEKESEEQDSRIQ